jgi:hypothetical protein
MRPVPPIEIRIDHRARQTSTGNIYSRFPFNLEVAGIGKEQYQPLRFFVDTTTHYSTIPLSWANQLKILHCPKVAGQPFQLCYRFPAIPHLAFSCTCVVSLPTMQSCHMSFHDLLTNFFIAMPDISPLAFVLRLRQPGHFGMDWRSPWS